MLTLPGIELCKAAQHVGFAHLMTGLEIQGHSLLQVAIGIVVVALADCDVAEPAQ